MSVDNKTIMSRLRACFYYGSNSVPDGIYQAKIHDIFFSEDGNAVEMTWILFVQSTNSWGISRHIIKNRDDIIAILELIRKCGGTVTSIEDMMESANSLIDTSQDISIDGGLITIAGQIGVQPEALTEQQPKQQGRVVNLATMQCKPTGSSRCIGRQTSARQNRLEPVPINLLIKTRHGS